MLLAIDTSAGSSVAVVSGELVLAECSTEDTMRHAEVIGELIEEALRQAGLDGATGRERIDAVVAGMGPGPFTGLRVGIAAARAFALGIDRPLVPVVSHDALALEEWDGGLRGELLVVTDARRRELYWSAYGLDDDGFARLDGPGLARPDELGYPDFTRVDATQVGAGALGRVARRMLDAGTAPEYTEPLYLRSPDVTPSTGRKRVTR